MLESELGQLGGTHRERLGKKHASLASVLIAGRARTS